MIRKFSMLQLFSLTDGRLSTTMNDVVNILSHVCGRDLYTHELPAASKYLEYKNPRWFQEAKKDLVRAKHQAATEDFTALMGFIEILYNKDYEVPQLKDEFDTSDFERFIRLKQYS